jgi:hypothetical protein
MLEEFRFRDHAVAMFDEIRQHIEYLRFQLTRPAAVAEFVETGVEFVVIEDVDHYSNPRPVDGCTSRQSPCNASSPDADV